MSNQEILKTLPGTVFSNIAELYLRRVEYMGDEYIKQADEILGGGDSILFVSDHPDTLSTTWTSNIVTKLANRKRTGVLLGHSFSPEKKKPIGYVIREIIAHHHAEPLFVKTPKYEQDEEERTAYNQAAIGSGNEILTSPSGVLFLYPQGTRNTTMQEARSGLSNFAARAGYVVPVTTVIGEDHPRVVIHPPMSGSRGIDWCKKQFGDEEGSRVFSDLVMTIIATAQPDTEKRGAYLEMSKELDQYIQSQRMEASLDERTSNILTAFIAWQNGEF